jgi:hypothetical protein
LRGRLAAIGAVRCDHFDPVSAQFLHVQIAVVSEIADQVLWLGLDHLEVEAQLHQANFMMVGGMRAYRTRQSMAINYRHDFHAFSPLRCADLRPAPLAITKVASMKHSSSSSAFGREARWNNFVGACAIARLCAESTEPASSTRRFG